ncbi:MAG TPA: sulfotransferase domain-containing protein, partial [Lacipirellulaceae bacterium]|nr:sulfotransferase domain-containing protein [Lacipirellulaceae bacterium]
IIWLASYPKSGNTWTRAFLHNFIGVDMPAEGDVYDINKMNVLSTSDNGPMWFEEVLGKPVKECTHEEIARARPAVHKYIHDESSGFIFLKTHNALVVHDGVPLHTPKYTAGGVYIVRNPLDVAISYSHHLDRTIDDTIEIMGSIGFTSPTNDKAVFQIQGSWSENVYSWTKRPNAALHVMRYEDMIDQPFESFGELAEFLQLPVDPERLQKAIDKASFKNLQEMEREKGFRERPAHAEKFFRQGKAGQWKFELTLNQIKRIVHAHGEQMDRFGYLKEAEAFLRNPAAGRRAQAG